MYYSLLYYCINLLLGNCYLYLFRKNYAKANRERIPSEIARQTSDEQVCTICLGKVREGQNVARIACMHTFHSQCLHKWSKKKTACPICKSRIDIIWCRFASFIDIFHSNFKLLNMQHFSGIEMINIVKIIIFKI